MSLLCKQYGLHLHGISLKGMIFVGVMLFAISNLMLIMNNVLIKIEIYV